MIVLDLQNVQIIEILGNIILRVVTFVGKAAKQIDLVADQRKAVTQPSARWQSGLWRFGLQFLPLPFGSLEFIQFVGVLAVLDHTAENQDAGSVDDESVRGTSRRNISLGGWHVPLVGSWR